MCQFCTSVATDDSVDFISGRERSLNSHTEHKHQVNRGRESSPHNPDKSVRTTTTTLPEDWTIPCAFHRNNLSSHKNSLLSTQENNTLVMLTLIFIPVISNKYSSFFLLRKTSLTFLSPCHQTTSRQATQLV